VTLTDDQSKYEFVRVSRIEMCIPGRFQWGVGPTFVRGVQHYRNTIPYHIQADVSRF